MSRTSNGDDMAQRLRHTLQAEFDRLLQQKPGPGGAWGAANDALNRFAARPVLCQFGDRLVLAYGVFVSLGFGAGVFYWLYLIAHRFHQPLPAVLPILGLVPAAYLGSRGLYLVERQLAVRLGQTRVAARGNAFYGGVLGALFYLVVIFRNDLRTLLFLLDCAAPTLALIYAFVKMGCLSYGCCPGRITDARLAVTYMSKINKAVGHYRLRGLRLHPLQVYEAIFGVALFALLSLQPAAAFGTGRSFGWFLVSFSVGRAIFVHFRYRFPGERANTIVWGVLNVALVATGIVILSGAAVRRGAGPPEAALSTEPASLVLLLGVSAAVVVVGVWLFAIQHRDMV
ncbi:MAG TPA: prolipoprotein diacylglyceryl transferase family protein [Methylomirabilota bacterium]|jgi:phosphatidylglycerol:prolipoprotein diacylglycerol transferase